MTGLASNSQRFRSALILLLKHEFTRADLRKAIDIADEIDQRLAQEYKFPWQPRVEFPERTFIRYVQRYRANGILRPIRFDRDPKRKGRPATVYRVDVRALTGLMLDESEYRKQVIARAKDREFTRINPIPHPGSEKSVALAALFALHGPGIAEKEEGARRRARNLGAVLPWSDIATHFRAGEMIVIGPPIRVVESRKQ